MTTQRRRGLHDDLRTTHTKKQPTADKYPARRFPIQHEIRQLEDELNSFNERIAELEDEGHRGHAMEVLKANAMDFARQIDELRSLLVEPATKASKGNL
jgi:predicted  nucleic acid-binding Zn-ribbon protein